MLARLSQTSRSTTPAPGTLAGHSTMASALPMQVATGPGEIEAAWRNLEGRAPVSPYQSFDLVAAWVRHAALGDGVEPRPAVLRDGQGRPVAILPFGIRRWGPARLAVYLGGRQFNANLPLVAPQAVLPPGGMAGLLDAYAALTGVDAFVLERQPLEWAGRPHPLLGLAHQPSPHRLARVVFGGPFEAYLAGQLSRASRQKLRRKQALLAEAGARLWEADTARGADAILATFARQKAARLAANGVRNPFADLGAMAFLRQAALAGLASPTGLRLVCLEAEGAIIATAGGVRHGDAFSWMINSFEAGHPLARHSPGDVLLAWLLAGQQSSGAASFDFGVGDEHFKRFWGNDVVAMADIVRPATPLGHLAARLIRLRLAAEREIRARPALFVRYKALRAPFAGR